MAKFGWKAAAKLLTSAGLAASGFLMGNAEARGSSKVPDAVTSNANDIMAKIAYFNVNHVRQMSSKKTLLIGLCSEQVFTRSGIGPQFTEVLDSGGVYQKIPSRLLSLTRQDTCPN